MFVGPSLRARGYELTRYRWNRKTGDAVFTYEKEGTPPVVLEANQPKYVSNTKSFDPVVDEDEDGAPWGNSAEHLA